MGLFPIVMNILQFWLIDSIVKLKEKNPILPITTTSNDEEHDHLVDPANTDSDEDTPTVTRRSRTRSPPPSPSPVPTPPGTGYGATQGKTKGKGKRRGDLPEISDWVMDSEDGRGAGSRPQSVGPDSPRPRLGNATASETWFMTSSIGRTQTTDVGVRP